MTTATINIPTTDSQKLLQGLLMGKGALDMGYYDIGSEWLTFPDLADKLGIYDEKTRNGFFTVLANRIEECEVDNETGKILSVNDGKGIVGVGFY